MTIATHTDHAAHLLQHPPAACAPLNAGLRIPVNLLAPSPLNPRKQWDTERIAKMAASLRANGQVQPIRVRPAPAYTPSNGRAPYEIVVGETRWRAAPDAGLASLEAMVGDYTDQQVVELGLAENRERNDLHPLDEADAYASLLRQPTGLQGYDSVEEMAAAVGTSPSYVYQRLKLRALCPVARKAFLDGAINASVALLIARMPDSGDQVNATNRILQGFGGEAYSFRAAAEFLRRDYMLSLARARFDIKAAYTVAGPCADCSKRSGAAPDLFADVASAGGGDMCQDARCYGAKAGEAHEQLLQAARDEGHTVLRAHDARRLLATPTATPTGHWRLADPCPTLTDSRKPLGELLPAGANRVLVEHPDSPGSVILLATDAVVRAALKRRGLLRPPVAAATPQPQPPAVASRAPKAGTPAAPPPAGVDTPPGGGGHVPGAEFSGQAAERALLDKAYGGAAAWHSTDPADKPHARTGEMFGHMLINALHTHLTEAEEPPVVALRLAVVKLFDDITVEATKALYGVMGWRFPTMGRDRMAYRNLSDDFEQHVASATPRRLADLLALLLVVERLSDGDITPDSAEPDSAWQQLATLYRIDMHSTWQQADAAARCGADMEAAYGGGLATQPPATAAAPQDATEAFLAAHAPATTRSSTEPGDGPSDQFDEDHNDD